MDAAHRRNSWQAALAVALFLGWPYLSFGQITITSSDAQAALSVGKQIAVLQSPANIMVPVGSASSTAQVWDFTGWTYKQTGENLVYSLGSAPGASNFPSANAAIRERYTDSTGTAETYYTFHTLSSSAYEFHGLTDSLGNVQATFSPAIKEIQFPLTMGTTWSYTQKTTAYGITYNGTFTQLVDAYGTLRLPHGTFSALREKIIAVETMSLGPIPISRTKTITYNFMTKEWGGISVSVDSTQESLTTAYSADGIIYSRPEGSGTDVEYHPAVLPHQLMLPQNYPNPFNPTTVISFQLPVASEVRLAVFDLLGHEVAVLVDERKEAGSYQMKYDASGLASGVYLYTLEANGQRLTRRLVYMK